MRVRWTESEEQFESKVHHSESFELNKRESTYVILACNERYLPKWRMVSPPQTPVALNIFINDLPYTILSSAVFVNASHRAIHHSSSSAASRLLLKDHVNWWVQWGHARWDVPSPYTFCSIFIISKHWQLLKLFPTDAEQHGHGEYASSTSTDAKPTSTTSDATGKCHFMLGWYPLKHSCCVTLVISFYQLWSTANMAITSRAMATYVYQ